MSFKSRFNEIDYSFTSIIRLLSTHVQSKSNFQSNSTICLQFEYKKVFFVANALYSNKRTEKRGRNPR